MSAAENGWQALGGFLIGFVFAIVCVIVLVAIVQLRDHFDVIAERKAEVAIANADALESFAASLSTAADGAAMQARVDAGLEHVRTWPTGAKVSRLSDHKRKYSGRRSA